MPKAPRRDPITGDPVEDETVPTDEDIVAKTRPHDVLRLQRRYVRKLHSLTADLNEVMAKLDSYELMSSEEINSARQQAIALWNTSNKLRPATTELARYASGLIEGVRLDKLTKIELQMQNAELEAAIENAAEAARPASRFRAA